MGKVRPFCRSGLEAIILRPYCGLLSEKKFHCMVYKIPLIFFKAPCADMSDFVKLIENNDEFSPGITMTFFDSQ